MNSPALLHALSYIDWQNYDQDELAARWARFEKRARIRSALKFGFWVTTLALATVFIVDGVNAFGESSRRHEATSNLRLLTIALAIYADRHDDVLPPNLEGTDALKQSLWPYVHADPPFISSNPNGGVIRANSAIFGARLSTLYSDQWETLLLYDSRVWPDGRCLVAYDADAAQWVQPVQLQKDLTASQARKKMPSAIPHL